MIENYIKQHRLDGRYIGEEAGRFDNYLGWKDFSLPPHLIFSHRKTDYTKSNFYEHLHVHDFYELVFYFSGDVEYVNRDLVNTPYRGNLIVNRPGEAHTTRLLKESSYDRFVLYFDREFLSFFGGELPIFLFIEEMPSFAVGFDRSAVDRIHDILCEIEDSFLREDELSMQDAYCKILSLFSLICSEGSGSAELRNIPEGVLKLKSYIDTHCTEIATVNEIATEFFYSREHLSRLFKRYFNIPISDYLAFRKAEESKRMLEEGRKVSDVCSLCGFGSTPAYIRAFKQFFKMTPSEYAKSKKL